MKLAFLTPGTGNYYCGVCMRDNSLAKYLIKSGHEVSMLPTYLPLFLDENPATQELPIFFGGINVYFASEHGLLQGEPSIITSKWGFWHRNCRFITADTHI